MKKSIITLLLALMTTASMAAYDFLVDGIYYYITGENEVSIAGQDFANYEYSSDFVVPDHVTYQGTNYKVTSIGTGAFMGCSGFTSVYIPNTVKSIGTDSFRGCPNLKYVHLGDSLETIGMSAFERCWTLATVDWPETLTSIEESAFECCQLSNVDFPASLTSIGRLAFLDNYPITSVLIPKTLTYVGPGAFASCRQLASIVVDEDNPVYDSREGCNAIIETATNVFVGGCKNSFIPDEITAIGDYALYDHNDLKKIRIPDKVTSIGDCAFYWDYQLDTIILPASLKTIGRYAFYHCYQTRYVNIPDSVTSIASGAFKECTGLRQLFIPKSVTSIGQDAFTTCSGLRSIVVEEGNPVYDSRDNCNALITTETNTLMAGCRNTVIPKTVTTIGIRAFFKHSYLKYIKIPDNVTIILYEAFRECGNLKKVDLGTGFDRTNGFIFYDDPKLMTVISRSPTPPVISKWQYDFCDQTFQNGTLYVPLESVELYREAEQWKRFVNIEGFAGLGPGDVDGNGTIDISDVTTLIDLLLAGDEPGFNADVNGDDVVDITDITKLIDDLLSGN